MELAKCLFMRKNVKKIQEKFLLLKSFYYDLHSWNIKTTCSCLRPLSLLLIFNEVLINNLIN